MLETPHVALGAVIAKTIPNPLISIPLSFMSHFVLDMVPHWNPHLNTEIKKYGKLTNKTLFIIALDLSVAVLFTLLTAYNSLDNQDYALNLLLCSMVAIIPDVAEAPYFLFGYKSKFLKIWIKFQKRIQADANLFWGLLTQILLFVSCAYYLFY